MKSASKDPKMFSSTKTIDPAWLAQTKMETANMVNAHKLLVSFLCLLRLWNYYSLSMRVLTLERIFYLLDYRILFCLL